MKRQLLLRLLLVMTFVFKIILATTLVSSLSCEDFKGQKLEDCNYILASDINNSEKEDLIKLLRTQNYEEVQFFQNQDTFVGLRLTTDKRSYKIDETIKVEIFPKDILVAITYGDITKFAKDKTSFKATESNRILAEYQGEKYERVITIIKIDRFLLAWKVFLLCLINYFVFSFLNKSEWVKKWLNVDS